MLERDRKVVAHAYGRVADFVMDHGRGSEVYDVDGNRFLDFVSGIAVNSTGHSHPHVVRAIQQQAEKFLHISSDFYHEKWVALSEKLDEIAPFDEPAMTFLGNSGTEAVEGAIKAARYHTGRHRFVGFIGGFHGRTQGSLNFTASKVTQRRGFAPYQRRDPRSLSECLSACAGHAARRPRLWRHGDELSSRSNLQDRRAADRRGGHSGRADSGRGGLRGAAAQLLPPPARTRATSTAFC